MVDAFEIVQLRRFAEGLALEAGKLLADYQGFVNPREKGPSDLVTEADFASQRLIAESIARTYPDHTLLAEEEGVVADPSKAYRWIVDPLDGTINYAHKLPFWCVSIGLEVRGEPIVGVIHDPIAGRTFSAGKGAGATLNGAPLAVSRADALARSLIATGLPTRFVADQARQVALLARFSDGTHSVRRTGSTALNLAFVAAGVFEAFYATSVNAWDVAAGVLLVTEAGGRVTRLDGSTYAIDRPGILASNGTIHEEAVAAALGAWPELAGL
ncbi:MAG: inositol monophosphatase family protein [Isosphaeraceae bacterium]|nr:inositol monophosphatase family protein [Isosphaeraceae bacterium]